LRGHLQHASLAIAQLAATLNPEIMDNLSLEGRALKDQTGELRSVSLLTATATLVIVSS
jgi:hypothetical protein